MNFPRRLRSPEPAHPRAVHLACEQPVSCCEQITETQICAAISRTAARAVSVRTVESTHFTLKTDNLNTEQITEQPAPCPLLFNAQLTHTTESAESQALPVAGQRPPIGQSQALPALLSAQIPRRRPPGYTLREQIPCQLPAPAAQIVTTESQALPCRESRSRAGVHWPEPGASPLRASTLAPAAQLVTTGQRSERARRAPTGQ